MGSPCHRCCRCEQNPSWDSHCVPTAPGSEAPLFPLPIRSYSAGADSPVRRHGSRPFLAVMGAPFYGNTHSSGGSGPL